MGLARQAYNTLFRRSSTFLLTIVVGAVLFERVFDEGLDRVWERNNEGVCKQTFNLLYINTVSPTKMLRYGAIMIAAWYIHTLSSS